MTFLTHYEAQFASKLALPDRPRDKCFRAIFEWLENHRRAPYTLIETGCVREAEAWSDGMSTVLFDAFLRQNGGQLISIDLSESHCRTARTLVNGNSRITHADGVQELARLANSPDGPRPDLLYLDSYDVDWSNPHDSALHHLKELCAAMPLLEGCLVVVDDHRRDGVIGKSRYIVDFMTAIGAKQVFDGYQAGWVMPPRQHRGIPATRRDKDGARLEPSRERSPQLRQLILKNHCSPGDVLMLTAALRDLHRAYPNEYITAVDTCFPDLWKHNPHVADLQSMSPDALRIDFGRPPLIDHCNSSPRHYIESGHDLLQRVLGRPVPLCDFAPDIYLSDDERALPPLGLAKPYWVMVAGGKRDVTVKWWPSSFPSRTG